jgi:hypothetical protein
MMKKLIVGLVVVGFATVLTACWPPQETVNCALNYNAKQCWDDATGVP